MFVKGLHAVASAATASSGTMVLSGSFMVVLNIGVLGVEAIAGDDNEIAVGRSSKLADLERSPF